MTELVCKPGSNVGEHYASVMFRGLITYNTKTSHDLETSLIIKTMPFLDGPKKALLEQMDVFTMEIKMYSEVVPIFEKFLKEANDDTQIACKCLYTSLTPHKTMVFEDLTKRNFKCPENLVDSNVSMKALEKLAKWHAISFKSNADDGEISKKFKCGAFESFPFEEFHLFRDGFILFLDMLKKEPEFKDYVPKFEKLIAEKVLSKALKGYKSSNDLPTNLFVLNHGDGHLKNTMVAEGKEIDVLWIDFQACYWGPAVMDLTYFLYMSIDPQFRATRKEEIIYTYFKTFTETLEKIGFKGNFPKLTNLYKDFLTYKDFGKLILSFINLMFNIFIVELMLFTTMMPKICHAIEHKEEAPAAGKILENQDFKKSLYFTKTYKDHVKQMLPEFLHKGYLD